MKISDWLSQYHTHDNLNDRLARESFQKQTGYKATWSEGYTTSEMEELIGVAGEMYSDDENVLHKPLQEIAVHCVYEYISRSTPIRSNGMGFIVRECISLLTQYGY